MVEYSYYEYVQGSEGYGEMAHLCRIALIFAARQCVQTSSTLSNLFLYLRHAQLVFTSLAHATTEDLYFRGFLIPPDAVILPDVDSVNHDSAIWGDPEVFRPNRYISNDNTLLNPEEFIAFFLGK